MQVTKCDACKTELTDEDYQFAGKIKVCRRFWTWDDYWWGKIDICKACFAGLKEIWLKACQERTRV